MLDLYVTVEHEDIKGSILQYFSPSLSYHLSLLFDLILYVPVIKFSVHVGTGLPGLNQCYARINMSCTRTQHSDASEA